MNLLNKGICIIEKIGKNKMSDNEDDDEEEKVIII